VRNPAKMLFLVCFESGEWPASTSGISIRRVPGNVSSMDRYRPCSFWREIF
jgi:hypothetical protein